MKYLNIVKTNWVHLLGFYTSTYIFNIILKLIGIERYRSWEKTLFFDLFFGVPLLLFTYGLIFLLSFYCLVIILDIIMFKLTNLKVIQILVIELLIIIAPFIYWAFQEEYWLWICLSISFLCTQYIRKKWLDKFV